ncbi:MAG: agmatinase [Saprospiraceae bacterium]|nr:agmatinase [Saprospiraceae bacterium]
MVKLLGIPYDANSSFMRGPSKAPSNIRRMHLQGSSNPSCENGKRIDFEGNLDDVGDMSLTGMDSATVFAEIESQVHGLLENKAKLISLGGDHSVTYPIVKAFSQYYRPLHILHFDAHSDLYHNFENNYYSHASPFARIMEQDLVASLTQVGLRTLCDHQRSQITRFGVKSIEIKNFNTDFIRSLKAPLYISFDLDVLDPAFAPGVSHHEPGGLTTREVLSCIQSINIEVVGADIVELNLDRDPYDQTAMLAYKVLKELWAIMQG